MRTVQFSGDVDEIVTQMTAWTVSLCLCIADEREGQKFDQGEVYGQYILQPASYSESSQLLLDVKCSNVPV